MRKILIIDSEVDGDAEDGYNESISIKEIEEGSSEYTKLVFDSLSLVNWTNLEEFKRLIITLFPHQQRNLKQSLEILIDTINQEELKRNKDYKKRQEEEEAKKQKKREALAAKKLARQIKQAEELLRKEGILKELAQNSDTGDK